MQFRQQGAGLLRSYGGKARSSRWDLSNFLNVKIVSALRSGTGRAFQKAGPDVEKALDPVLVFLRGTTNQYEFVRYRYYEHFGRTSKSARYAGWLSFRVRKVIAHILKWMRNLTGSQSNRFWIGAERLNRGASVTTLARQFWSATAICSARSKDGFFRIRLRSRICRPSHIRLLGPYLIYPLPAEQDYSRFISRLNYCYWEFKHQCLQMFGVKLNKYQ